MKPDLLYCNFEVAREMANHRAPTTATAVFLEVRYQTMVMKNDCWVTQPIYFKDDLISPRKYEL